MKKDSIFFYIYKTTNLINNKIYVGQRCSLVTPDLDYKYIGSGVVIQRSIKKYGKENFKKEILEICNIEELDSREIFWISKLNSSNPNIGYNLCEGGRGPKGYKHSDEMIEANRQRNIGRKHSEETKRKISEGNKGKKQTKEAVEKVRLQNLGRKRSEETKLKLKLVWKPRTPWNKGVKMKEETKQKMITSLKKLPSNRKGMSFPEEGKVKLREYWNRPDRLTNLSNKLKKSYLTRDKIKCPHCNCDFYAGMYSRWHGDKCKKINQNVNT